MDKINTYKLDPSGVAVTNATVHSQTRKRFSKIGRPHRIAAAIALILAALGIMASAASAGTLSASGGVVTYEAKGGEANRVTLTQSVVNGNDSVTVKDSGAKVTAGAGCTGSPVHCDLGKLNKVVVDLGNKDDTLDATDVQVKMTIDAGSGDDTIDAGSGADSIDGHSGVDFLHGHAGNDMIHGNDGKDHLFGEDGNDKVFGDGNDDHLNGGAGADTLDGGIGGDVLTGGADKDTYLGGGGNDTITADDGLGGESVDCGSSPFDGGDFAHVDANDIVSNDCDNVQR
jgi:Ca2+-binding RTX toxin-like protein